MLHVHPQSAETLDAALALAAHGYQVFPCHYKTKAPATRRGFYEATTNPATIKRWFGGDLQKNLAVRTGVISGTWVLDVDDALSLDALQAAHGPLPATRMSASARGYHMWFASAGLPVPSSTGRVAPGLDVRGELGYMVVAPSVHPDGPHYRWLNDDAPVFAPEWLVSLALKPQPTTQPRTPCSSMPESSGRYGEAALQREIDALANTPPGSRNHQLNRAAFCLHQLVAGGELDRATVRQALVDAATANGLASDPDDGPRSIERTIASGARAGLQQPRSRYGRR